MSDEIELPPLARQLLADFEQSGPALALDEPMLAAWRERCEGVVEAERADVASALVAAALKFHRIGGERAARGIQQLCELTAVLLGAAAAAAVFEGTDLPEERYRRVLGPREAPRAPRAEEQKPAAPGVKPKRGLS